MNVLKTFIAGVAVASFALPAFAGDLTIEKLRAKPSLGVAKNSAAFFTLNNPNDKADKLVSVETTVSRKAELHTHLKVDGVFKMRQVEHIDIPAHGSAVLQSGGLHVMLIGVHNKLRVGDSFKLKLNFEHAPSMNVVVPVVKLTGHKMKMKMKMKKEMKSD